MKVTPVLFDRTIALMFRAVNHFRKFESFPVDFGDGTPLFPAEIHFLEYVSGHPGCSLTGAALDLDITKSAVSQFAKKLVGDGYLKRASESRGGREACLSLTDKGTFIVEGHRAYHQNFNTRLIDFFGPCADSDLETVNRFLERFLDFEPE